MTPRAGRLQLVIRPTAEWLEMSVSDDGQGVLQRKSNTFSSRNAPGSTVREEFATYYPLADLMRWLGGDPFIQIGRHAAANLEAIEHVIHYGDRLYRVQLRDRGSTEITYSGAS